MFDDNTCIAFFLFSFFLSLLNRCQYVYISFFFILSFFVVQMLNYGI